MARRSSPKLPLTSRPPRFPTNRPPPATVRSVLATNRTSPATARSLLASSRPSPAAVRNLLGTAPPLLAGARGGDHAVDGMQCGAHGRATAGAVAVDGI